MRPRIYISNGLLGRVSPETIAAVLAHERAHARGRHGSLQSLGRTVSHAFSFFPPMRLAADHLILALELSADERAVEVVGDPLVLASALVDVAAHTRGRPVGSLAAGSDGLGARVGRLTRSRPSDRATRARAGSFAAAFAGAVLLSIALSLPLSARNLTGSARTEAVHAVCHLPHDQGWATADVAR
jgi:beta-lactamase regulating signal transducer with metallopeptidase domain